VVAAIGALAFASCDTAFSGLPGAGATPRTAAPSIGFADPAGTVSAAASVDLLAGQTIPAGSVALTYADGVLRVQYSTKDGWGLQEAHLAVGASLASIPTNKAGNPVVGSFPHKATGLGGATSYAFDVPMTAQAGQTLYVAAHAVVSRPRADGSVQSETAWGAGTRITAKGNWATYFTVTFAALLEDDPVYEDVGTAFAYGGTYARSFLSDGFSRWGWTNGPLVAGTYVFDLYAGAGQSDLDKGTFVGTVTVAYSGSTAVAEYKMENGYVLAQTHFYAGSAPYPVDRRGNPTVAPGQYPAIHDGLDYAGADTLSVSGLTGGIYAIAHATVFRRTN
jgi:hypothetical protein